jgi:4-hydroxythreonine-4-phosphate dehydrogenase
MTTLPIAITCGDPAGVGPELIEKWLKSNPTLAKDVVIIGPFSWLEKLPLPAKQKCGVGELSYQIRSGIPDPQGSSIALASMEMAAKGTEEGRFRAVVTGPINKNAFAKMGYPFPGQTEFFADRWKGEAVMAFAGGKLTVGLVTRHVALKDVPQSLNAEEIRRTTLALIHLRKKMGDSQPRIAVCGLNPHAGENGLLGREDEAIIRPVVESLRQEGHSVTGPLSADTIFYRHLQGEFDAVVAMYHDQGLTALKTIDFSTAANLSLGLKFIRTSPDHGTGYEIAGREKADVGSLTSAIKLADLLSS